MDTNEKERTVTVTVNMTEKAFADLAKVADEWKVSRDEAIERAVDFFGWRVDSAREYRELKKEREEFEEKAFFKHLDEVAEKEGLTEHEIQEEIAWFEGSRSVREEEFWLRKYYDW